MIVVQEERKIRAFIPPLISAGYEAGKWTGQFEAVSLLVDMSGFTRLTATLMQHKRDGAEILTGVLNEVFDTIISHVYVHGGFVSAFAGDSFTALFPIKQGDTPLRATQTAFFIRYFFDQQDGIATKYGRFDLNVKIGLGCGQVQWRILPLLGEEHLTYYFHGPAIDSCIEAQRIASHNEIVADRCLMPDLWPYITADNHPTHHKLQSCNLNLPPLSVENTLLQRDTLARFIAPDILELPSQAEFREVCNIFISFNEPTQIEQLSHFTATIAQLADSYGGYFNKIDCGDKGWIILVLFGAPIAYENSLERAAEFLLTLKQRRFPGIQWRAGLTSGTVYAGIIGGHYQCEYTAIGNVVNLAARLMVGAAWNEIRVPETIARHPGFKFTHQGELVYKGFTQPIATYTLQQQRIEQKFFDQSLIGRRLELAQLRRYTMPIFTNQFGGIIHIYGEGGIGKSHLAYEFYKALSRKQKFSWFIAQTDQILRNPFNAFTYFLKRYFNQSTQNRTDENRKQFEKRLSQLVTTVSRCSWPDSQTLQQELLRMASVLGALLGLRWPNSVYEQLDAQSRYENTLFAIKTLLLIESRLQPVIFLIEDAHWLDEASQALLAMLTRTIDQNPLLIITTMRYKDDGSKPTLTLDQQVPVYEIELSYLSNTDLQYLAETHLGGPIHPDLYQLLLEKSQGNPFYAQQYLFYFAQNELLVYQQDSWTLRRDSTDPAKALPATINAILMARIDRLTHSVKEVVKAAAVLGLEFNLTVLTKIIQGDLDILEDGEQLSDYVREAKQEQIWNNLNKVRYIFKHALLRDSAYEMQLRARLRQIHHLAGEAYETIYGDNLEPHYATLAHHYDQAGVIPKARYYLIKAGQGALSISAYREANKLLSKALTLFTNETEAIADRAQATRLLGHACTQLGNVAEAKRQFQISLELAQQQKDLHGIAVAQRELGYVLAREGELTQAEAHLSQSLLLSQKLEDPEEIAHTLYKLVFVLWRLGQETEALDYLQQSLTIARQYGNQQGIARALIGLGNISLMSHNMEKAQLYFDEVIAISRQLGNRSWLARALNNLAIVVSKQENYERAQDLYREALQIWYDTDSLLYQAVGLNDLGRTTLMLGDLDTAETYIRQSLELSLKLDNKPNALLTLISLAEILLHKRQPKRAALCLGLALNHPATYRDIKVEVEPLLPKLTAALTPDALATALEEGANLTLTSVLKQVLAV